MSSPVNPASHDPADDSDDDFPVPPVAPAKGVVRKEVEFGDFNEEDFDDDFDDDFEEEMEDEYELAEIEGEVEVEVAEVDEEDLVDLPLVAKIVKEADDSDDGFDDAVPAAEEEVEFEDEVE